MISPNSPCTVSVAVTAEARSLALELVLAVQQAQRVPDPAIFPPQEWRRIMEERQARAVQIWLAHGETAPVGTALIERVPLAHAYWPSCPHPAVATAARAGELLELGGVAVLPQAQGRGVAAALRSELVRYLAAHSTFAVSTAWRDQPGAVAFGESAGAELIAEDERFRRYLWVPARLRP